MIYKKIFVISLLFAVSTLLAYSEEHAGEAELVPAEVSEFAYRKGPAVSFGLGASNFLITEDVSITLPTGAIEVGYGFSEQLLLYTDLNAILPKIGIGYRYFIPQFNNKFHNFTNFGVGGIGGISYWIITGGIGYQWARWGTTDVSLSYNRFSLGELFGEPVDAGAFSVSTMFRAILW